MGLRYEKSIGKVIPEAKRGQWIEFEDQNGRGFAQPDFLFECDTRVVVLEAKYTWTPAGHEQLERLYIPLVGLITGQKVSGIVICKKLVSQMQGRAVFVALDSALAWQGKSCVLHWAGLTTQL